MQIVKDEPKPESKAFMRRFEKRKARYEAFMSWTGSDYPVRPSEVKKFIREIIAALDKQLPPIHAALSERKPGLMLYIKKLKNKQAHDLDTKYKKYNKRKKKGAKKR